MTERGYIFKYECQNETDPNRQGKLCGLSYMHGKKEKKKGEVEGLEGGERERTKHLQMKHGKLCIVLLQAFMCSQCCMRCLLSGMHL